jgi:hypothetical protein
MASWTLAAKAADPPVEAEFSYASIELGFAEPMRIWDNQIRRDLVRTYPELPLRCHWSDDVLLECAIEPPAKARPATRYRIELGPGLLTQEGTSLGSQVLHAETDRPSLRAYVEGWERGMPGLTIIGNMAMAAEEVRAVLQVRDGARLVPYALESLSRFDHGDDEDRFRLHLSGEVGPDVRLDLRVAPGLRSKAGTLRGDQDESLLTVRANESFHVRSVSCRQRNEFRTWSLEGARKLLDCLPGEPIILTFSQMPDDASRERFAKALPAGVVLGEWREGDDDYWRGGDKRDRLAPGAMLRFIVPEANTRVALALDGLAVAGVPLEPLTMDVHTTDARPVLEARGQRVASASCWTLAHCLHLGCWASMRQARRCVLPRWVANCIRMKCGCQRENPTRGWWCRRKWTTRSCAREDGPGGTSWPRTRRRRRTCSRQAAWSLPRRTSILPFGLASARSLPGLSLGRERARSSARAWNW